MPIAAPLYKRVGRSDSVAAGRAVNGAVLRAACSAYVPACYYW